MKQKIDKMLQLFSDMESFKHNDSLSKLLEEETQSELSEADLELVAAATMPDYEKFKTYLETKELK